MALSRGVKTILWQLLAFKNLIIIIITPLVLLPLILDIGTRESKCAFVVIVMAVMWCTESLPIAVTSLLPVVLVPMTGVMTAKEICKEYLNDTSMLFVGGLILAVAVEKWNLHKRIALGVLLLVGAEPRWLMLGMMLPTWFLSMWISNTATTAMMIPIVQAILNQLKGAQTETSATSYINPGVDIQLEENGVGEKGREKETGIESEDVVSVETSDTKPEDPAFSRLCKGLCLAVAYSANIGGIGSLTGTGPNVVLKGQSDLEFAKYGVKNPITFLSWMIMCLPLSFLFLVILWFWMQLYFLRCSCTKTPVERKMGVKLVIRQAWRDLGPISFAEAAVFLHFLLMVVLWVGRDIGGVGGWGDLFPEGYVRDSTSAILVSVLLFIFPSNIYKLFASLTGAGRSKLEPLLVWQDVHDKLPWGVLLLLGGGFALAKACSESGLSELIGEQLEVFADLDPWIVNLIVCYIVAMATEVTSNTATATLMMPIMANLAIRMNMNPLYFMWPAALASSFAFMLPVATPPNAIVFSSGYIRVIDMVMAGFILNILGVPLLEFALHTWGNAYFHLDVLAPEFKSDLTNSTS